MSVAVFTFARKHSQRCRDKMLRPFAGTTLTDICLSKFARLEYPTFLAAHEPEFRDKCRTHDVSFVQRDAHQVQIDGPLVEILAFLHEVDYDHLLLVNACLPMLRIDTVESFLDDCIEHGNRPAFAVIRKRNFFVDEQKRPLNFDITKKSLNTKEVPPVLEFAHALYFFDRRYLLETGMYWDWSEVRLIEAGSHIELIDVDTEEEFTVAEAVYRHLNGGDRGDVGGTAT